MHPLSSIQLANCLLQTLNAYGPYRFSLAKTDCTVQVANLRFTTTSGELWRQNKKKLSCLYQFLGFRFPFNQRQTIWGRPEASIQIVWCFTASAEYTAKSAYDALFQGAVSFGPYERIWKTWAPPKCRFFLWTVAHNHGWTADRLVRRGLPHPSECPLCDQEDEDIQHLPIGCVSARQFWYSLLHRVGLSILTPQAT